MREQRHDAGVRHPAPDRDGVAASTVDTEVSADLAKTVFDVRATAGEPIRITKLVVVPLVDRCARARNSPTGARARSSGPRPTGSRRLFAEQTRVARRLLGGDRHRTARRRHRPSRRCAGTCSSSARHRPAPRSRASPPRASPPAGYDGHYFWDTEIYVVPFLAYTDPEAARKLLRFRWAMLDAARARAPRDEPDRRPLPVAHDQRRGGVGLLRRRHGAVPHQRRGRVRPHALPRGDAATSTSSPTRVPRSSSRRPACGPTSGSTRATASQTFHIHGSPGPTSTRPSSTTTSTRT